MNPCVSRCFGHRLGACGAPLLALLLAGCASQSKFDANGIPARRYYVGGGYVLQYRAPADGTVLVVEERQRKVWSTKSVTTDEVFEFEAYLPGDPDVEKRLGMKPGQAKFSLYFIPAEEPSGEE